MNVQVQLSWAQLDGMRGARPRKEFLEGARQAQAWVALTAEAYRRLTGAPGEPKEVQELTTMELVMSFRKATARWAAAGFPLVSQAVFLQRLQACRGCPHWIRSFIPKCKVCGCRALKLWLASESCPLPEPEQKWKAL